MTDAPKRCGAKTRSGAPCEQWAVRGRARCRMHGGTQPRGLALPQTKHGRFSKDMPTRMLANYQAALKDPDAIALHEELALATSREADLLARVDTGEAGVHWRQMRIAITDFRRATREGDADAAAAAVRDMERLTDLGIADYRAWSELKDVIELRRRLADTERKRIEAAQQTITSEKAMLMVAAVVDAVRRHVDDRKVLAAIGFELNRIVGPDDEGRASGPDDG